MNAFEAMHLSAINNQSVTMVNPTEEDIENLLAECDDHTDMVDFWGEHPDGGSWRVYVKVEPV